MPAVSRFLMTVLVATTLVGCGGSSTSVASPTPTSQPTASSNATPTDPTPTPSTAAKTILSTDGCHFAWQMLYRISSKGLKWSNSEITDEEFAKILKEDGSDYLLAATADATGASLAWLEENRTKLSQARVLLIDGAAYDDVSTLFVDAVQNVSDGMDIYCAGYKE